jgi:4-hydroxy-2-oxoheptanedioate aldolase
MALAPASTPQGSGAVLSIPFIPAIEGVLNAGFNWAIIDTEHSPLTRAEQITMVAVAQCGCTPVLIRVTANDPAVIGDALDAGADGVVVPMVNTAADALSAVKATRYPPSGTRSIGPYRAASGSPLCIVQIETREGVDHVDEIAAIDGVDSLMVGPGDLALSIGRIPGVDTHHDEMKALYRHIMETCADLGKPAGTFALLGAEDARRTWELNWDYVADFHDRLALQMAARTHHRGKRKSG